MARIQCDKKATSITTIQYLFIFPNMIDIFCVPCANRSFEAALVCPACETSLTQPDDIGFVDLNPSQEYKSSILSGLRPEVIMDICTRALSFWTYQTSQEAKYQEMTQKKLEGKLSTVEKQHQRMTRFRETVGSLQRDLEQEKRKAVGLSEQVEEKTRQLSRLQTTLDRNKKRPLFSTPDMPTPMLGPLDTDVHGVPEPHHGYHTTGVSSQIIHAAFPNGSQQQQQQQQHIRSCRPSTDPDDSPCASTTTSSS
ncbi:cyclin B1 interacting protein 1, E3 ubiquitin protein ligase [Podila verticillata]|nr:cyclin B1 interacting protein 1, E3 ubiquitin protein ligase [Podila verticillata]